MRTFKGTNAEWRKSITWIIVVVLAVLPFAGGPVWFNSVLVVLAYLLGLISGVGSAPREVPEPERMALAKEVLDGLDGATIDTALGHIAGGQNVAAVKAIRHAKHTGLREAKHAVDLLEAYGKDWRDAGGDAK